MNEIQDRYERFPAFVKQVEARLDRCMAEMTKELKVMSRTEQQCREMVWGLNRQSRREDAGYEGRGSDEGRAVGAAG